MPLINITVVLLLVAANAFFVATEFSLVAVRPADRRREEARGWLRVLRWRTPEMTAFGPGHGSQNHGP